MAAPKAKNPKKTTSKDAERAPKRSSKEPRTGRASSKRSASRSGSQAPATYREFVARHPVLGQAHEAVARAVEEAGPLEPKTLALVKIGICVGAGLESALRSHVRRAIKLGSTEAEIEQAILLGMNTIGFPRTVAAWAWARTRFAAPE